MAYRVRLAGGVVDEDTGELITPASPRWADYQRHLEAHGAILPPIPEPPPPPPQFDALAAGMARRQRMLRDLALSNPTEALLRKAGLK